MGHKWLPLLPAFTSVLELDPQTYSEAYYPRGNISPSPGVGVLMALSWVGDLSAGSPPGVSTQQHGHQRVNERKEAQGVLAFEQWGDR